MAKRINFEDDIFYINLLIRLCRDALNLDLDLGIFMKKIQSDISFIDNALTELVRELEQKTQMVELGDQANNLLEVEERFCSLLASIQGSNNVMDRELVSDYLSASQHRRVLAGGLDSGEAHRLEDPSLVSPMELNELLKSGE